MANKDKPATVSRTACIVMVLGALVIGFYLGGVVSSAIRGDGHDHDASPQASMPQAKQSPDQSAGMDSEIQKARQNAQDNPKSADAWSHLGHLYFDTDQPALAVQAYRKSLALEPHDANVWTDLGVMYRRSGNPAKAVEAFDTALEHKPGHEIALFNKGIVLLNDMDDPEGALSAWDTLLSNNPNAKTPSGSPVRSIADELRTRIQAEKAVESMGAQQ